MTGLIRNYTMLARSLTSLISKTIILSEKMALDQRFEIYEVVTNGVAENSIILEREASSLWTI